MKSVENKGYGEISGRPIWLVNNRYQVERDRRGTHLIIDQKTGVEYFVPFLGSNRDHPLIEYTVVSKKGRRRIAFSETVSVKILNPGGPRCRELEAILKQIED